MEAVIGCMRASRCCKGACGGLMGGGGGGGGSRTTRPNLKECMRSGDQETTLLTSFLIG